MYSGGSDRIYIAKMNATNVMFLANKTGHFIIKLWRVLSLRSLQSSLLKSSGISGQSSIPNRNFIDVFNKSCPKYVIVGIFVEF